VAWTERYVRSDAAGGGDGTTTANSGANGAWTLAEAITNEAAGMRINVRAGTYASTSTSRTLAATGTQTAPIWWRGVDSSFGAIADSNGAATAGTDIPELTFSTGQLVIGGNYHIVSNIASSGAQTTNGQIRVNGQGCTLFRVRSTCTSSNANGCAFSLGSGANGSSLVACYGSSNALADVYTFSGSASLIGCIASGGKDGFALSTLSVQLFACIARGCANDGIKSAVTTSTIQTIVNCSIYDVDGHGIEFSGSISSALLTVANCHFEGCNQSGKAGIANTSGGNLYSAHLVGNSYRDCTSNTSGITESFLLADNGTVGGSGYTDPTNNDFNATTYLKGIGFPGQFEYRSGNVGYFDTGAVQRVEPAAGGLLRSPGMRGGVDG